MSIYQNQISGIPGVDTLGQVVPIAKSLIGGNIVSILLRQAILKNAFSRPQKTISSNSVQPVYNPKVFVAGVIPVSVRSQESYTYRSDVTNHAVESGAIFSDHVIQQPLRVDLSFEISNWTRGDAQSALEALEKVWRERQVLSFQTTHKQLDNMVINSIQATNEAPIWGTLVCRASFQQLKLVTLNVVRFSEEDVTPSQIQAEPPVTDDSARKGGSSEINLGAKKPKSIFSSEEDKAAQIAQFGELQAYQKAVFMS